jgi:hypothetical protein
MPDRDQPDDHRDRDLALFALVCLAAAHAGALEQQSLLENEEAVRGLQLLAERAELVDLDGDDAEARMAAVWERFGPRDRAFRPEWAAALRSERSGLSDALALASATVNYWQRGPAR